MRNASPQSLPVLILGIGLPHLINHIGELAVRVAASLGDDNGLADVVEPFSQLVDFAVELVHLLTSAPGHLAGFDQPVRPLILVADLCSNRFDLGSVVVRLRREPRYIKQHQQRQYLALDAVVVVMAMILASPAVCRVSAKEIAAVAALVRVTQARAAPALPDT